MLSVGLVGLGGGSVLGGCSAFTEGGGAVPPGLGAFAGPGTPIISRVLTVLRAGRPTALGLIRGRRSGDRGPGAGLGPRGGHVPRPGDALTHHSGLVAAVRGPVPPVGDHVTARRSGITPPGHAVTLLGRPVATQNISEPGYPVEQPWPQRGTGTAPGAAPGQGLAEHLLGPHRQIPHNITESGDHLPQLEIPVPRDGGTPVRDSRPPGGHVDLTICPGGAALMVRGRVRLTDGHHPTLAAARGTASLP